MRQDDLEKLAVPYTNDDAIESGRRFAVAVGADVASAGELVSRMKPKVRTAFFGSTKPILGFTRLGRLMRPVARYWILTLLARRSRMEP